jgi:hypothetical protein
MLLEQHIKLRNVLLIRFHFAFCSVNVARSFNIPRFYVGMLSRRDEGAFETGFAQKVGKLSMHNYACSG